MNNQQYAWIAIVIVGIVGGIEIGYAISNVHTHYRMHHDDFSGYNDHNGWYHHTGFMMQDPAFRQQMYSSMFDSTQYREEISNYLAEHPSALQSWCDTMMNNPLAMQTMQNMMSHGMMGGMMHGMMMGNMNKMGGMGMMNQNNTQGTTGMQSMNSMGNMTHK